MSNNKYLAYPNESASDPGSRFVQHSHDAKIVINAPCIISPNITPNKNGKDTMLRRAGLASLYPGTPYMFVIC